jgi:hypothetical protein
MPMIYELLVDGMKWAVNDLCVTMRVLGKRFLTIRWMKTWQSC